MHASLILRSTALYRSCNQIVQPPQHLVAHLLQNCRLFGTTMVSRTEKPSSSCAENLLQVPLCARGMTVFDVDKFSTSVSCPAIMMSAPDCSVIQKLGLGTKLLRNLNGIKPITSVADDDSKRIVLFDPNNLNDEEKQKVLSRIDEATGKTHTFIDHSLELKYDNWDLKRAIRGVLPQGYDFSSFTQSGHLIHCNFREELAPYKKVLAQLIGNKVKNCRTVVNKLDGINSEYRNFQLELLFGEPDYIVEVSEGGLKYKLDFSKVFWNSRLEHEHLRVLKKLDSRSLVYDACAGVGPFALPAAKKKAARKVYANDLNPDSVEWMKTNVKINKIDDKKLSIHNMDAVEFLRGPVVEDLMKEIEQCSDTEWTPPSGAHILMNLPAYAVNFLPAFRGLLYDKNVATLPFKVNAYCYLFAKAHEEVPDEWFEKRAREMVSEKLQWPDIKINYAHHVRTVSSRKEMYCMEIDLPLELLTAKPTTETKTKNGTTNDDNETEPPEKRQKVSDES